MSFSKEFKEFAVKGNVIDLAVGVIIGGAFGKIVTVLVERIIMPPIGLFLGGTDFSQLRVILKAAGADGKGEVSIGYGELIQTSINFLIVALAIFFLIRGVNALKRKDLAVPDSAAPAPTPEDVVLLREIRDLLRSR